VFELIARENYRETPLYNFCSNKVSGQPVKCTDGEEPLASVIMDQSGDLYGTTFTGGPYGTNGTVFELQ
jgi:hypothetical protein